MSYSPQLLKSLEKSISLDRLSKYRSAANGDRSQAINLYLWNIALSESLYGPIHHAEVILRNGLYSRMVSGFGVNWFDSVQLTPHLTKLLQDAKDSLTKEGKNITDSRLVAELNLGFWLGLLTKRYETKLWIPHLRHAFAQGPRGLPRQTTYDQVNGMRSLRNRIAHHEPIFERKLTDDYNAILMLVSWMCNDTADWIQRNNRFLQVWSAKP